MRPTTGCDRQQVSILHTDVLLDPFDAEWRNLRDAAVAADEAGFDGVWTWDRLSSTRPGSANCDCRVRTQDGRAGGSSWRRDQYAGAAPPAAWPAANGTHRPRQFWPFRSVPQHGLRRFQRSVARQQVPRT